MDFANEAAIKQLQSFMDGVDDSLKRTFQNVHQGFIRQTLVRFLKARDWNVDKAHKMLLECLDWRVQNEIDMILTVSMVLKISYPESGSYRRAIYGTCTTFVVVLNIINESSNKKPIVPSDLYRSIRDSQLVGLSGYSKEGIPVVAVGVGQSTYDKAPVNYYVQSHIQMNEYRDRVVLPHASRKYGRPVYTCLKILDMTGLKLSHLNQIKLLTVISTIDDLNYPEKTDTYYIVNVPYIFSACWKAVKPLLHERTRRKIQVLQGSGRDELLKIMDYASLPHFCKREGSGSSRHSRNGGTTENCFSLEHTFHQQLYNYAKEQAALSDSRPLKHGSVHVAFPEPDTDDARIAKTIESEFHRLGANNTLSRSLSGLDIEIN